MRRLEFLLLLAACFATSTFAQDMTGAIEGSILDPSGAAVPNATVTVKNTDRNQVAATLTTGANGVYSAPLLIVGTYSVRVEKRGFKTDTRSGILLNAKDTLHINMKMEVGA